MDSKSPRMGDEITLVNSEHADEITVVQVTDEPAEDIIKTERIEPADDHVAIININEDNTDTDQTENRMSPSFSNAFPSTAISLQRLNETAQQSSGMFVYLPFHVTFLSSHSAVNLSDLDSLVDFDCLDIL